MPQHTARIMEGRTLRNRLFAQVEAAAEALQVQGIQPHLAVILVGHNPASEVYVKSKLKVADKLGLKATLHRLPETALQSDVDSLIEELNGDKDVHGILLQLPLPQPLDGVQATNEIVPAKDVDGLTSANVGRYETGRQGAAFLPCTPLGVMRLLAAYDVPLKGRHAVVVGRSNLVGRPMATLLSQAHATVTSCHRFTTDLAAITRQADVLVVATGNACLIRPDMVKPGAVLVDVGMNRGPDGTLLGDCDFGRCADVAGAITPVPGGVGPMTVASLMTNTIEACCLQHNLPRPQWQLR